MKKLCSYILILAFFCLNVLELPAFAEITYAKKVKCDNNKYALEKNGIIISEKFYDNIYILPFTYLINGENFCKDIAFLMKQNCVKIVFLNSENNIKKGISIYKNKNKYGALISDKDLIYIKPLFKKIYTKEKNPELFNHLDINTKNSIIAEKSSKWLILDNFGDEKEVLSEIQSEKLKKYIKENNIKVEPQIKIGNTKNVTYDGNTYVLQLDKNKINSETLNIPLKDKIVIFGLLPFLPAALILAIPIIIVGAIVIGPFILIFYKVFLKDI